jgi:tape measure domain-containing protein
VANPTIRVTADTGQAQAAIKGLSNSLHSVEGSARQAQKSLGTLEQTTRLAVGAFAALGAAVGVREIVDYTARWTDLNSRLRNATGSQEAAKQALDAISKSARGTYSNLEETAKVFVRNSMALNQLGYTTNEQIKVSEALNNAIAVSGARGVEAASALDAFAQAVARGKMEGEDFNRLIENSPRIVKALADGLGVTTGEFRNMITEGRITSDVMIPALISQMSKLQAEAEAMPATISDAFIVLQNSLFEFIGSTDEALGISQALSQGLVFLADNTGVLVGAIAGLTVAVGALLIPLIPAATLMAVVTGGVAVAGAIALGGALGYAAQQAGMFADKTNESAAETQRLANASKDAAAATQRQADAARKVVAEQTKTLQPLFDKLKLERESIGLNETQVSIKRNIAEAARILKDQEGAITGAVRQRIIDETMLLQTKHLQQSINEALKESQAESVRLGITDLNQREQQAAVDQARVKYGDMLTQEMEKQIRATVAQTQSNRETLDITNARIAAERALNGELTAAQSLQRGTGVRQRLDPNAALSTEYKMDQDALKLHLEQKLMSEQEYQTALMALKQQYAQQSNQLYIQQSQSEQQQRNTAIQAEQMRMGKTAEQARTYADFSMKTDAEKAQFGIDQAAQMFTALGQQNKKAFQLAKAFNIANAIMNTYMGATKALASYPPPFNFIAAAATVAMGMMQVSQIRSQQYQGREKGGPIAAGMPYLVGEAGPEIIRAPSGGGTVIPNDQIGMGGGVNVNFTINAVDATGVDELLYDRREVIKGIISDAMLEKGQRF